VHQTDAKRGKLKSERLEKHLQRNT